MDERVAPNYYAKIKHPMCFTVMRQKLASDAYTTWRAFQADFELIIHNARTYNNSKTKCHRCAIALQRNVNKILKQHELDVRKAFNLLYPEAAAAAAAAMQAEAGVQQLGLQPAAPAGSTQGLENSELLSADITAGSLGGTPASPRSARATADQAAATGLGAEPGKLDAAAAAQGMGAGAAPQQARAPQPQPQATQFKLRPLPPAPAVCTYMSDNEEEEDLLRKEQQLHLLPLSNLEPVPLPPPASQQGAGTAAELGGSSARSPPPITAATYYQQLVPIETVLTQLREAALRQPWPSDAAAAVAGKRSGAGAQAPAAGAPAVAADAAATEPQQQGPGEAAAPAGQVPADAEGAARAGQDAFGCSGRNPQWKEARRPVEWQCRWLELRLRELGAQRQWLEEQLGVGQGSGSAGSGTAAANAAATGGSGGSRTAAEGSSSAAAAAAAAAGASGSAGSSADVAAELARKQAALSAAAQRFTHGGPAAQQQGQGQGQFQAQQSSGPAPEQQPKQEGVEKGVTGSSAQAGKEAVSLPMHRVRRPIASNPFFLARAGPEAVSALLPPQQQQQPQQAPEQGAGTAEEGVLSPQQGMTQEQQQPAQRAGAEAAAQDMEEEEVPGVVHGALEALETQLLGLRRALQAAFKLDSKAAGSMRGGRTGLYGQRGPHGHHHHHHHGSAMARKPSSIRGPPGTAPAAAGAAAGGSQAGQPGQGQAARPAGAGGLSVSAPRPGGPELVKRKRSESDLGDAAAGAGGAGGSGWAGGLASMRSGERGTVGAACACACHGLCLCSLWGWAVMRVDCPCGGQCCGVSGRVGQAGGWGCGCTGVHAHVPKGPTWPMPAAPLWLLLSMPAVRHLHPARA